MDGDGDKESSASEIPYLTYDEHGQEVLSPGHKTSYSSSIVISLLTPPLIALTEVETIKSMSATFTPSRMTPLLLRGKLSFIDLSIKLRR